MADRTDKVPENIPGPYYVDRTCIDCELCREKAPANFKREDESGYSYVYKQPANAQETKQCEEALFECPVEAIGHDGN